MKGNLIQKQRVRLALAVLIFAIIGEATADFQVRSVYRPCEPFGDVAQLPYYDAIERRTYDPEDGIVHIDVIGSEIMRFYGRFNVNASQLRMDKLSNKSAGIGVNPMAIGLVSRTSATQNSVGLELAIGLTWDPCFRTELEYLVNRNFHYKSSPVFNGRGVPAVAFSSEIKNNVLLFNFYYDFEGFGGLRPYAFAGVGGGANDAYSVGLPVGPGGGEVVKRRVCVAWNVGAGFRIRFIPFWYLDVKYRYTNLGLPQMETNTIKLNSNYWMNALSVGFMYIF